MSFILKSYLLGIFSNKLIAILIRAAVIIVIVVFLMPLIFPSLNDKMLKIVFAMLSIILVEVISFRISSSIQNPSNRDRVLDTKISDKKISIPTFNKKYLSLFLYTSDICMNDLIPKTTYFEIEVQEDKDAKLFNHSIKPIFALSVLSCENLLSNLDRYPFIKKMLKIITSNRSHEVSFVISRKVIFSDQENKQDVLFILRAVQALGGFFRKKLNINLLIDNMAELNGFQILAKKLSDKSHLFQLKFSANASVRENILEQFERHFSIFVDNLKKEIVLMPFDSLEEAQDVHIFIQQMYHCKERMKSLLMNIVNICSLRPIKNFNTIVIFISFFSSQARSTKIDFLASNAFQLCLKV